MANAFDVAVVGLGAMGSSVLYHLARRRKKVVAFDRYAPPHSLGSTHGKTRIIRETYFEDPRYVPLVRRAYELWDELARAANRPLFRKTGGLMIGPKAGELVQGAERSAIEHKIPHRVFSAEAIRMRFPAYDPLDEWVGLVEGRAGVLFPELCVTTALELAGRHGAAVHLNDPVVRWEASGDGVVVRTANGAYTADRLVLAGGPWMRELVPDLSLPLAVERQVFYWFEPTSHAEYFQPDKCPVSLWEYAPGKIFGLLPDFGDGVKLSVHHHGELTTADTVRRDVTQAEIPPVIDLLRRFLPRAKGRLLDTSVCLYTNTPDSHFIIDAHPLHPQALLLSACSGHGFKFASAIGEIAADLVTEGKAKLDVSLFALDRFSRRD
jgi:sarcosine oxidase